MGGEGRGEKGRAVWDCRTLLHMAKPNSTWKEGALVVVWKRSRTGVPSVIEASAGQVFIGRSVTQGPVSQIISFPSPQLEVPGEGAMSSLGLHDWEKGQDHKQTRPS